MRLFKKIAMITIIACSFAAIIGFNVTVNAVDTIVATCDFSTKASGNSSYSNEWTYDTNWTIMGGANNNKGWAFLKLGGKNSTLINPNYIATKSPISKTVSKVTVTTNVGNLAKGSVDSWGLLVFSDSEMTNQIDSVSGGTMTKGVSETFDFTPTSGSLWPINCYYKLTFTLSNTTTTNGIVWLDKVDFYEGVSLQNLNIPAATLSGKTVNITSVANAISYNVGLFKTEDDTTPFKEFNTTETSYTINDAPQDYEFFVKVQAVADSLAYLDSEYSASIGSITNTTIETKSVSEMLDLTAESAFPYTYYEVTGLVGVIEDDVLGVFDFIDSNDPNKSIKVNGLMNATKEQNTFSTLNISEGDTVTLKGYKFGNEENAEMVGSYFVSKTTNYFNAFRILETKASLKVLYSKIGGSSSETTNAYYEGSTTNMVAENNASNINLDASLFTVTPTKTGNLFPGLNTDGGIRMYSSSGNTLEFAINSGAIISISITYLSGYANGVIKVDDSEITPTIDADNNLLYTYQISAPSFVIDSTANNTRFTNVKIVYADSLIEYTNMETSLRFGTCITKELYDNLEVLDSNLEFGVAITNGSTDITTDNVAANKIAIDPVRVSSFGANIEDENGQYYQFALSLNDIPATDYTQTLSAACYVCINGTYYVMKTKTGSVASIAEEYINATDTSRYAEHLGMLNFIKG